MKNDPSTEVDDQPRGGLEASEAVVRTLKDLDPVEAVAPATDALTILERELGQE
jgi:hypothetical protein